MSTASSVRSRKTGTPSLFPKDTKEQDVAPPTLPELPEVPYTPAFISQSQIYALIFIAAIVAHGTLYSVTFGTTTAPSPSASSLQAGGPPPSSMPQSNSYFAQKHNVFNQYFAKQAWFWTTLVIFAHLFTTPNFTFASLFSSSSNPSQPSSTSSSSSSKAARLPGYQTPRRRFAKYLAATTFWILLTIWMVGPGLFERAMIWSGGECSLAVPEGICSSLADCRGVGNAELVKQTGGGGGLAFITVPSRFCTYRTPITPQTFPSLFTDIEGGSSLSEKWQHLKPHWSGGHDISGHVFLLTMSALLMLDQVLPTIALMYNDPARLDALGGGGVQHKATAVAGLVISGLWVFILSKTATYFHTVLEKISGMILAIVGLVLFQYVGASIQD